MSQVQIALMDESFASNGSGTLETCLSKFFFGHDCQNKLGTDSFEHRRND